MFAATREVTDRFSKVSKVLWRGLAGSIGQALQGSNLLGRTGTVRQGLAVVFSAEQIVTHGVCNKRKVKNLDDDEGVVV